MSGARHRTDVLSAVRSVGAWCLLGIIMGSATLVLLALRVTRSPARWARGVVERAASLYLRTSPLYRVSVTGVERLPVDEPFVLVANHESGLDGACLMALAPRARFLAAGWLFRAPVIGFVMRACEHIPVSRRDAAARPVEVASQALADGTNVAAFPEGEYSDGELGALRRGAFVAARQTGASIVPVRLRGSGAAWRPGTWIVQGRNPVSIEVLDPVPGEAVRHTELEALVERVRAALGTGET